MDILPCTPASGPCFWLCCLLALLSSNSYTPPSSSTFKAAAAPAGPSGKETDRLSLLAFRDGISGDPTGALRSWNDSVSYCSWLGITCDRRHLGRVTALHLPSLGLSGFISPSLANLTFLRELNLSINQFYGGIPPQLGSLSRLRYFDLGVNNLGGKIPSNLSRCSKLKIIYLDNNQLVGEIPMDLGSLPNLRHLSVQSNRITGAIPPSLGNLSSDFFRILALDDNILTGGIPSMLGRLTNLRFLGMGLNKLSGMVPPRLYNLSNMEAFLVAYNRLWGILPSNLGTALPKLSFFNVGGNQFEGNIPSSLANATALQKISLLGNRFRGGIPSNLGLLRELEWFDVGLNRLEAREPKDWEFLISLTNCTRLRLISISHNDLGGALPNSIANLSTNLVHLSMGANQIIGSIPMEIGNLRGLTKLGMAANQFHGSIPPTLCKLTNLEGLQLSVNKLSGEIPSELGNLTLLSVLYLDHNNLSGSIPTSLGQLQHLQNLDVSVNSLNGSIPNEFLTPFTLVRLDLSNNFLKGSLPPQIGLLTNLQYLNLSVNRFSGYIPPTLGDCQSMEELYLQSNSFEGTIPPSLRKLKGIIMLDLSVNNLSGKIPEFLEDYKYLQHLNLSFNDFIGEVPKNGVFANASAISLIGNKRICGGVSALQLPTCMPKAEKERKSSSLSYKVIISIAIGGLCILITSCFITYYYWTRKSKEKTSMTSSFEIKYKKISYHDLVKATDGFSCNNLIGKGSFGSVYKGILDGDEIVAVKVFNIQRQGASKSFKSECEALKNIRHRNLVRIISVCSSIDFYGNDFKAMVLEFFPNGSLDKWLYPEPEVGMRCLDFGQRLCIANDVASAIDYLHNYCNLPIVHCDLKPSNILLDDNMIAHVGDFGLARFILRTSSENHENQSSTIGIKGSIGYVAPEYGLGSPISRHGDVYSFGILLLELFTARRPVDNMFKDGLSLQKFIERDLSGHAMDIIDPCLILLNSEVESFHNDQNDSSSSGERVQQCFALLMQIGLNCTKESPQERMTMGAVVKEIHLIQEAYLQLTRSVAS